MSVIDRLIKADRESPKRVLIIGDWMTDVYLQGHMMGCQDGCLKFVEDKRIEVPGGSANAARSLDHWSVQKVSPFDGRVGPIKTRFMVEGKCVFRHDNDRRKFDSVLVRKEALATLESWRPDSVLLSDYDKGILTPDFIRDVVSICAQRNIPCVADAKHGPEMYHGAIIKANGLWQSQYGARADVVTWGADPPVVAGVELHKLPLVKCVNHVGAGDCFAAHLMLALAYGFSLKEAAAVAHSAGRVYVQRRYNTPPLPDEIKRDMLEGTRIRSADRMYGV